MPATVRLRLSPINSEGGFTCFPLVFFAPIDRLSCIDFQASSLRHLASTSRFFASTSSVREASTLALEVQLSGVRLSLSGSTEAALGSTSLGSDFSESRYLSKLFPIGLWSDFVRFDALSSTFQSWIHFYWDRLPETHVSRRSTSLGSTSEVDFPYVASSIP